MKGDKYVRRYLHGVMIKYYSVNLLFTWLTLFVDIAAIVLRALTFSRYKKTDKVPELGEENSKELEK